MTPVWFPREQPLAAQAAWIPAVRLSLLTQRLGQLPPFRLETLRCIQTVQGVLLSSQEPEQLPWLDQALWLAPEPLAPALWLPTLWQPDGSLPLLEQACLARTGGPCALIPTDAVLSGQSQSSQGTLLVNIQPMHPLTLWLQTANAPAQDASET